MTIKTQNNYFKKNIHQMNKNSSQGHGQFPNLQVLGDIQVTTTQSNYTL